ncbi:14020_t:CDS:2 [Dentiscutata erythropus]|uniref:14020_t:CDS:1 n=1 Tax=Dentiscutata erythropus TaxID=1348616 RepID=A0A9N8Z5B1_9GLOM|nr:14020_t:CDS:2 [Dentiscutata erythropus]
MSSSNSITDKSSSITWTKLSLGELRDLCIVCGLATNGNKEELSANLKAYFEKRKEKLPAMLFRDEVGVDNPDNNCDQGHFKDNANALPHNSVKSNNDSNLGTSDSFLSALRKIEKKMDQNFVLLQDQQIRETEEESFLDEAWPRATALQIVGCNNKMIGKYKDRILAVSASPFYKAGSWNSKRKSSFYKDDKKGSSSKYYYASISSFESEQGEAYWQNKKRKKSYPFHAGKDKKPTGYSKAFTCYNCGGIGHFSTNCPFPNAKSFQNLSKKDTYFNFCNTTSQQSFPSSEETILSCLAWLDLTDTISSCSYILAAISRKHLEAGLPDPTKNFRGSSILTQAKITYS